MKRRLRQAKRKKDRVNNLPHPYMVYIIILIILLGLMLLSKVNFTNINFQVTGFITGDNTLDEYPEGSSNSSNTSEWLMFGRDLRRTNYYPGTLNLTNFRLIWKKTLGILYPNPLINNNVLYISLRYNKTYALNATTGEQIWNYTYINSSISKQALSNNILYINTDNNGTYALNATTGEQIWNYSIKNHAIYNSPIIFENTVYVATLNGVDSVILALNATTGEQIWNYTPVDEFRYSSPAIANNILYIGSRRSNKTYALNITSRSLLWSSNIMQKEIRGTPTVVNDIVYIGSQDGKFYALNASDGSHIWNYTTGDSIQSCPAYVDDTIYIASNDNKTYALNATTGEQIWNITYTNPQETLDKRTEPVVTDKYMIFYNEDNFTIINRTDKTTLFVYNDTRIGSSLKSSAIISNGVVYFASDANDTVYAFGPNTAPTITTDTPGTATTATNSYMVNWTASDADSVDTLYISCYADEDDTGYDKVIVCFENTTNDGSQSCDTSNWPSGRTYYIWCQADDQSNVSNSISKDYASGTLTINNSKNWGMFSKDLSHTGYYPGEINTSNLLLLWKFNVTDMVTSSASVSDGIVYVASDSGTLFALNTTTGKQLWNYSAGDIVQSTPAVYNGMVYFGAFDNQLYALNASDGTSIWNYTADSVVKSSPIISNNIVYFGSQDGKTYAVNASDGSLIWSYAALAFDSSPALYNEIVYIGSNDNNLYALNSTDGSHIWNYTTGDWVTSSPTVVDNVVYFGSKDNKVYAINASDGSHIWNYTTGGDIDHSTPAIKNNILYIGSTDNKTYALNISDGSHIWNYTTSGNITSSPAVTKNNILFIASGDTYIYALNATDGSHLWDYTLDSQVQRSGPVIADNQIFIGSDSQYLYAFATNNLPVINSIEIKPASPEPGEQLNCTFNVTDADSGDLLNVSVTWFNGSVHITAYDATFINVTKNQLYNNATGAVTENITQLNENWTCQITVTDSTNTTLQNSSAVTVSDNTAPNLTFVDPTDDDNATVNRNYTYINVTVIDVLSNISSCLLEWDNGTKTNITMNMSEIGKDIFCYYNKTELSDARYNYTVFANDSANNFNNTVKRTVIINTQGPEISIQNPQNISYNRTNITLNYTVTDIVNVSSCWYEFNSINTTLVNCTNTTFIALEGNNTIILYANDSSNHISNITSVFRVDIDVPVVNVSSPGNGNNETNASIVFNFTVVDNYTSVLSCSLFINNSLNQTNSSVQNNTPTTFTVNFSEGNYEYNIRCNDTADNQGNSSVYSFTVNLNPELTINSPTEMSKAYKKTNDTVSINYTYSELYLKNITIFILNSTGGVVNTTIVSNLTNGTVTRIDNVSLLNYSEANYSVNITIFDSLNQNTSAFENKSIAVDNTAPAVVSYGPTDTVTSSSTTFRVTTNENATCRYDTEDVNYTNMSNAFTGSGKNHTATLSSLSTGTYTYYVKCNDTAGNVNETPYTATITVSIEDSTISSFGVGGGGSILDSDTKTVSFSMITSENPVSISSFSSSIGLKKIEIELKESVSGATITIKKLDSNPIDLSVPGTAYKYFNFSWFA